uniref:ADAMTS-like protein 4 n=1 Tax=Amazona collaria TaxID=241587 RepID=A0A8B9FNJ2_9PSIT
MPARLRARVAALRGAAAALRPALVHGPRRRPPRVPNEALPLGRWHTVRAGQRLHGRRLCQHHPHAGAHRECVGTNGGHRGRRSPPGSRLTALPLRFPVQTPVDGAWGPWGPWSGCSRSCGGGVRLSHRGCTAPEPRHGGRFCRGKRTRVQSCSVEQCPGALTFREEQCAAYNHGPELVRGLPAPRDWVPRYSGVAERDRCKLICQSQTLGYYHVADGTPCSPESTGVCVRGRCFPAGCDRIIGSKKKFDKCMNCGGDGSGCTKVSGSFTRPRYGYNDVVTIPAGATHVLVRQVSDPGAEDVFLALRRPDGGSLLNGGYILVPSATDVALGTGITLHYSGATADTEMLRARGPLPQPVVLQALVVDERRPPRLKYSFFVPRRSSEAWEKQKAQILEILRNHEGVEPAVDTPLLPAPLSPGPSARPREPPPGSLPPRPCPGVLSPGTHVRSRLLGPRSPLTAPTASGGACNGGAGPGHPARVRRYPHQFQHVGPTTS